MTSNYSARSGSVSLEFLPVRPTEVGILSGVSWGSRRNCTSGGGDFFSGHATYTLPSPKYVSTVGWSITVWCISIILCFRLNAAPIEWHDSLILFHWRILHDSEDDKVYCFAHRAASPYFSRSCFWDSMSITARFGAGIPSNLDTAIGSHGTWVFYFTKDNMVYTSSGDENNGTLTSMEPLDANMFSKQPCNSAAAMEGASGNEFYYFKGEDHYFTSSPSELYLNGQICWGWWSWETAACTSCSLL